MNSAQRREARYARRKARREEKRLAKLGPCDDFELVFSYENLYAAYVKCCAGVRWKASTQSFIANAPMNVWKLHRDLMAGTYRSSGFFEFDINERGKTRHIRSTRFSERVVQKCLCDNALTPVLSYGLIYDNGACLKDKGYAFASNRLRTHLARHYTKHGDEGYVVLFDFSKYFDSIEHGILKSIIRSSFSDERIIELTCHFIDAFGDVGIGLGSQVSQISAIRYASELDHYIKDVLHVKGYGRYMDDGYLICESKDHAIKCLDAIRRNCKGNGIIINEKKTHIVKMSHGFTFLQAKYHFDGWKIVKRLSRKSVTRERRKLKKLAMNGIDTTQSFASWRGYAIQFDSHTTIKAMEEWRDRCLLQSKETT